MSDEVSQEPSFPDPSMLARLTAACERFDAAWKVGQRPRIEDFLGDTTGEERRLLLYKLIVAEVFYRRHGETPTLEEYQRRFPGCDISGLVSMREKSDPPSAEDSQATGPYHHRGCYPLAPSCSRRHPECC